MKHQIPSTNNQLIFHDGYVTHACVPKYGTSLCRHER